jgi:hypothetical protein
MIIILVKDAFCTSEKRYQVLIQVWLESEREEVLVLDSRCHSCFREDLWHLIGSTKSYGHTYLQLLISLDETVA